MKLARTAGWGNGVRSWIRRTFAGGCLLASAFAYGGTSPQVQVTAVEHSIEKDRVRIVVRFNAAVQYVGGTATDPYRLYFDLRGTRPAAALPASAVVGDSVVQRVRLGQYKPGVTRVVLDMTRPAPYTATFVANPPRLLIEVMRNGTAPVNATPPPHSASAPASMHQTRSVSRKKPAPPSVAAVAPQPEPPPVPMAPEQMPPVPPQVSYQDGLLTITATNSTLTDVLQAVATRTSATLDTPPGLTGQRVAVRLGPAPPREVLSDLLQGMDFVLVGANDDPEAVRSIIVSSGSSGAVAASPPPVFMPATPAEEETAPPEQPGSNPPVANQAPPSPAPRNPPPKTPEELLEELRRPQEQQPNAQPH